MLNTCLLSPEKDPMGAAIADYARSGKAARLRVFSSQFDEDEIPVKELFRSEASMPHLEQTALKLSTGRILDVGAGSGCHSLAKGRKRRARHRHLSPVRRSNEAKRRMPCHTDQPLQRTVLWGIRYRPDVDERIGHCGQTGKHAAILP